MTPPTRYPRAFSEDQRTRGRATKSRMSDDFTREIIPAIMAVVEEVGPSMTRVAEVLNIHWVPTQNGGLWRGNQVTSTLKRARALGLIDEKGAEPS